MDDDPLCDLCTVQRYPNDFSWLLRCVNSKLRFIRDLFTSTGAICWRRSHCDSEQLRDCWLRSELFDCDSNFGSCGVLHCSKGIALQTVVQLEKLARSLQTLGKPRSDSSYQSLVSQSRHPPTEQDDETSSRGTLRSCIQLCQLHCG